MKRIESILKPRQPRRGALLLVVLSILVLFALVGLTFVVSAAAFKGGMQANLNRDNTVDDASHELDFALGQVVRGPRKGTRSVLQDQDLLGDMWGDQSVSVVQLSSGDITIARPQTGGGTSITQFWEISLAANSMPSGLFRIEEYYTGSILTFTSGEAKGQSHRILHYRLVYDESASPATFAGVKFVIDQDPVVVQEYVMDLNNDLKYQPNSGDGFVVNDPPFNGTGRGFDPTQNTSGSPATKRTLNLRDNSYQDPIALAPNIRAVLPLGMVNSNSQTVSVNAGGLDEPYDAPDYQNPFLAYIPNGTTSGSGSPTSDILPSFHRQDLLKWWVSYLAKVDTDFAALTSAQQRALFRNPNTDTSSWMATITPSMLTHIKNIRRKTIFRPLIEDHPNFNGGNPNFDPFAENLNCAWDIDNDLDGIPDSIWVDLGFPIKTDRQGRRSKPLAAILVKDLDSLINLNAHGYYTQLKAFEDGSLLSGTPTAGAATTLLPAGSGQFHGLYSPSWNQTGTPMPMQLPLGSGYGPAEVSLLSLFPTNEAFNLIDYRYRPLPGLPQSNPGTPGISATDDPRSKMDEMGLANYFNTSINNRFATPPDRLGLGRAYFDYAGRMRFQPRIDGTTLTSQGVPGTIGQTIDSPYEFDPLHRYRYDMPYTYQELERILRYEEYDSSLVFENPDRLLNLASSAFSSPAKRRLVTTASFQVPTANRVDIPYDLRNEGIVGSNDNRFFYDDITNQATVRSASSRRPAPTLVTLLQNRLLKENSTWASMATAQKNILLKEKMCQLLPPEIMRGEAFDLNRFLEAPADGVDNDGNSYTDDVFELQSYAQMMFQNSLTTSNYVTPNGGFLNWVSGTSGPGANAPNFGTPSFSNPVSYSASRQLMARYLYVMALLMMEDQYIVPAVDSSLTAPLPEKLAKRRIAQWAINVVDYRDKDAVMTPFEYDLNPFKVDTGTNNDPWNVDGNLTTGTSDTWRGLVWGAEAPELLLTETLAFHDRRTKDTEYDNSSRNSTEKTRKGDTGMAMGGTFDPNLDQYRIPQGSLFIELYNPRNLATNNTYFPPELYDANGLRLDQKTPSGNPVWRIVITESELNTNASRTNVIDSIANRPDTVNFQPLDSIGTTTDVAGFAMNGSNTSLENYDIERIIWFINPGTAPTDNRVFYYPGASSLRIQPDGYTVIGPRKTTYIGSRPYQGSGGNPADQRINEPASQSIILSGNSEGQFAFTGTLSLSGLRKSTDKDFVVVAADPVDKKSGLAYSNDPDGAPGSGLSTGNMVGIGLSVSEPMRTGYYPEPTQMNVAPNLVVQDLYTDGYVNSPATMFCPDTPFDTDASLGFPLSFSSQLSDTGTYPDKYNKAAPEVIKDYKTAILQRLANPLCDFNATTNPYISVDSMGIDLTVFDGEDSYAVASSNNSYGGSPAEADWDPDETGDQQGNTSSRQSTDVYFASRERGRRQNSSLTDNPGATELELGNSLGDHLGMLGQLHSNIVGSTLNMIPWFNRTPAIHASPVDTTLVAGTASSDEHFGRKVVHSLGYLNHCFGKPIASSATVNSAYTSSPLPIESNRSDNPYNSTSNTTVYNNPLAWLHWPNSPFVSKYDLMMVPSSSPQRLLFEYTRNRTKTDGSYLSPYFESGVTDGDSLDASKAPYGYLMNFFHSAKTSSLTSGSPNNANMSLQLARILDFVTVPSRFNGTNKWFNVAQFNPSTSTASTDLRKNSTSGKVDDARLGYLFPFNRRSEFREPGKINLNTISSKLVYESIFPSVFWNNSSNDAFNFASWSDFVKARGNKLTSGDDSTYPSRFARPFRPAAAAEMMPDIGTTSSSDKRLQLAPSEAGILRSIEPENTSNKRPLFDLTLSGNPDINGTSFNATTNRSMLHYRTDDNPVLRYQAYQRLDNMAGFQSNVYAVWITVGYFELEQSPTGVDSTHPDGWRLGVEKGAYTGEIERHRGFYIIDRSIPVGYLPGEDLNVENTIMLRRFIE
ncbi:hypothetical protein GC197_00710 [bacterium]|nr:hypothetical protein [bacterium]